MHVLASGVRFDEVLARFATFMDSEQIRYAVLGVEATELSDVCQSGTIGRRRRNTRTPIASGLDASK